MAATPVESSIVEDDPCTLVLRPASERGLWSMSARHRELAVGAVGIRVRRVAGRIEARRFREGPELATDERGPVA